MLSPMKSRVVAAGVGALALLSLAACSSGSGTGASTATTVKLGEASFVTLPPVLTSTTTTAVPGSGGATIAGEEAYTVASGDYPLKVAKNFCITLDALVTYNGWSSANQF